MIEGLILLLAIPAGFLIAYWANDELIIGRVWFRWIMGVSIIIVGLSLFYRNQTAAWTGSFILIATVVSYWKSFDRKWTKKRI